MEIEFDERDTSITFYNSRMLFRSAAVWSLSRLYRLIQMGLSYRYLPRYVHLSIVIVPRPSLNKWIYRTDPLP